MDGPAGAGKSSIAKLLAKKLGFTYINSGAMFRCVAIYILKNNISLENQSLLEESIKKGKISISQTKDDFFLNNEKVTDRLHTPEVSSLVPVIAKIPFVRNFVEGNSANIAKTQDIVIEGRDTTTVVFPNATLKCWVFADPLIRATRRWEQNNKDGKLEDVVNEVQKRDKMDTERNIAPMKRANDAFDVDTTNLTIEEAVETISKEFSKRIKK